MATYFQSGKSVAPDLAFGVPWAPRDETRTHRYRVPLAWVDGADGGILFIQYGLMPEPIRTWLTVDEWSLWVAKNHAAPVIEEPADTAFEHVDDEGDC